MGSPSHRFRPTMLLACSGPIVWALHFVLIYGFHGLVCARPDIDWTWRGWSMPDVLIVAAGAVALLLIAGFVARAWRFNGRDPELTRFMRWFTAGLAVLSAIGVVYETAAVWLVAGCT